MISSTQTGLLKHRPKGCVEGKFQAQKGYDEARVYTTVQVDLGQFLQPELAPDMELFFALTAQSASIAALEAYNLANLHLVRLIQEGKELPTLNQGFFRRCCALASGSSRITDDREGELCATMKYVSRCALIIGPFPATSQAQRHEQS